MRARLCRLEYHQELPLSPEAAWAFFSRPDNLARICPPYLDFRVTSPPVERIYAGMIIAYRLRPLAGVPLVWTTEITQAREPEFFVDEQRSGPYRFWHHQHLFRAIPGGVAMTDLVHYRLPCGRLGDLVAGKLVERRLAAIFAYRRRVLAERFGAIGREA